MLVAITQFVLRSRIPSDMLNQQSVIIMPVVEAIEIPRLPYHTTPRIELHLTGNSTTANLLSNTYRLPVRNLLPKTLDTNQPTPRHVCQPEPPDHIQARSSPQPHLHTQQSQQHPSHTYTAELQSKQKAITKLNPRPQDPTAVEKKNTLPPPRAPVAVGNRTAARLDSTHSGLCASHAGNLPAGIRRDIGTYLQVTVQ